MNQILAALLPHALELGLTALAAVATWAAARAARFLGLKSDETVRAALLELVERVAEDGRERVSAMLDDAKAEAPGEHDLVGVVSAPVIALSADYVARSMPGALRQLGVNRAALEGMFRRRLGIDE